MKKSNKFFGKEINQYFIEHYNKSCSELLISYLFDMNKLNCANIDTIEKLVEEYQTIYDLNSYLLVSESAPWQKQILVEFGYRLRARYDRKKEKS